MKRKHNKSGMSVAELCIVLAVLSIVSTLVVSFTTMVNVRSAAAVTKNRVADDLRLSKVVLQNWAETITKQGAQISVSDDEQSLTATIAGVDYSAALVEDGIIATLPNGERLQCPIDEITALTFAELKSDDGDAIWFCTAEYELPRSGRDSVTQQTIFCINPHSGDVAVRSEGAI